MDLWPDVDVLPGGWSLMSTCFFFGGRPAVADVELHFRTLMSRMFFFFLLAGQMVMSTLIFGPKISPVFFFFAGRRTPVPDVELILGD